MANDDKVSVFIDGSNLYHSLKEVATRTDLDFSNAKHCIASFLESPVTLPLRCPCQELPTKPYRIPVSQVVVEAPVMGYKCDVSCNVNDKRLYLTSLARTPKPYEVVVASEAKQSGGDGATPHPQIATSRHSRDSLRSQ